MVADRVPTVDHITPIARGGSWAGPFQILCRRCNIEKADHIEGTDQERGKR